MFIKNKKFDPYIIAEIGVNHECDLKNAKKLIDLAKKGGADAAKFQFYKADKITSKNSPAYWDLNKEKTKSQYKLFKKYDHFDKKEYNTLQKYCSKKKIDFLCTPFDVDAVKFLKNKVKFFKISSSDITNFELLKSVAKTKKPVLLSTGASNISEIRIAINYLKKNGTSKISLMHCILNYPTDNLNANLGMIIGIKKKFPSYKVGYSDHTKPDKNLSNLFIATILGAEVIEKHFTDNKKKIGNDHYHSMDYKNLLNLRNNLKKLRQLYGSDKKDFLASEKNSRKFARRAIYTTKKIKKGQRLTKLNIISKRPLLNGLSASYFDKVIGKKINLDLSPDSIIKKSHLIYK